MAPSQDYQYEYFNVTFPAEYVAHVEINRPKKLNAWFDVMWQNLRTIFDRLSIDPDVRAILLSGIGDRAFTAGLDLNAAAEGPVLGNGGDDDSAPQDQARIARSFLRYVLDFQDCVTSVERCSKPVVCLLHGISFGMGIDLACCADVRIAARDLRGCVKEVDIGLAADLGTLSRLPRVVGSGSWVKDVSLTAREFGADESKAVGFVSEVVADRAAGVQRGVELCSLLASKSPVAVWGTKALIDYSRDHTIEEGLRYSALWNASMIQTDDVRQAVGASMQKTKPKFSKL